MSNDLQSILARHNLRGMNVANFSGSSQQRPPPQQNHPYQYPAPVPQQRVQYPWGAAGQGSGNVALGSVPTARPSFAWPSPPQPQYTIDPRHYSYNIWGKAPVYSLTGEGEEEEGKEDVEGEEGEAAAAEEEAVIDAEAAAEVGESIETQKPAEEAATEAVPKKTASDTGEKNIPPKDPISDAAAEPVAEESNPNVPAAQQSSDSLQEEATTAIPTASDPPVEEQTATESIETAPQEGEPEVPPEPVASTQPEEEAHASEPAPTDSIDEVEPNHQDPGEIIEPANASEGKSAASEAPAAPFEVVEDVKQEDDNPDSPSKPAQEEQVDTSQSSEAGAEDLKQNVITSAEVLDPSAGESHPVESPGGDISQEGLLSRNISTMEQHPATEPDATHVEVQSSDLVTSPEETDETVTAEVLTASDNIQDTVPAASDEVVQIIDVNNNDSTDDTAAIIVVDVATSDSLEDTNIPPPPPPPAPHVTIAEPTKPSKYSKKKPSSSKSRHGEKLKEKPVEIIPLKEGKVKTVAKGKSQKKVRGRGGKVADGESGEVIPPPPPPLPIVDVPPPAPSPPPSGHVIEVVAVEGMQVIDHTGGKDEVEDAIVIITDTSLPDLEVDAGDTAADEEPPIEGVSGEKEASSHAADADTATLPGEEDKTPEIVQAADTALVAAPDQPEKDEPTPAAADPSSSPDADVSEGAEIEQTVEAEAPEQKDDDAITDSSSMPEVDIIAAALDGEDHIKEDHVEEAEDLAGPEKEPLESHEETASAESGSNIPSENPAVGSALQDQDVENSPPEDEGPHSPEATIPEVEKLDGAQSDDTTHDVPGTDPSTAQEDKTVKPSSPATEEPKSPDNVSDTVVEDNDASSKPTNDAVETATSEPPIESSTIEDSTSEVPKEVSTSEASESDSANTAGMGSVTSEETEASSCPDSSVPDNGITPAASAEVAAEPAPTLMELAALVLPSDSASQNTDDAAATKDESNSETLDGDMSTGQTAAESEASDPVSEVATVEDGSSKEEVVETNHLDQDSENADSVPLEAAIPSETATQGASLEPDCKNEDGGLEASKEPTGEVPNESKEPEVSTETTEPAEIVADDQEMDQPDSKADKAHGVEAEHDDEKTAPDQVDKAQTDDEPVVDGSTNSPDGDAQPVQTTEAPEAGDSTLSDAADVHAIDAQDTMAPAEVATESPETPPITSEEQDHGSDESNKNGPILDAPEAAEVAENDTKDSSSSTVEGQVAGEATEAEAGDAYISPAEDAGAPKKEEKAPSDTADDSVVEGLAVPVAESESDAAQSPAPIDEKASQTSGPAAVTEEDSAADKAEADELTSEPVVTKEVEEQKPAAEELPTEPAFGESDGTEEPAAEQVEQASETVVVEAADSGACELSEEKDPTKPSEPAVEEGSSEQSAGAKFEHIIEQPADTTEDATPSTTAVGAETDQKSCQESPLPVLAEETQVTEVAEALEHTTPEKLSKPEETSEATKPVDFAPSPKDAPEPNEESSPGQEPIPIFEGEAVEPSQPEDAIREPEESPEEPQSSVPEGQEASVQEPITEVEVFPGDSTSKQSRCETISDSNSGRRSPLIEEPAPDQPAPEEAAPPSPSKHSPKVSFDEPPILTKGKEPASPPKERRRSSKPSSSNHHSSSRHKVKDVSRPPSDQKSSSAATSSRRRSSTTTTPQSGLFRRLSTTNSRSSRADAAEQAEIRRRAAELAAREQKVQRQLERARKRAALEEQERLLREKEEELARLRAAEKEKKRARREEQKRREQEALEQEQLARERAEEEAKAKELERAERRKRRRESGRTHNEDDRLRAHRHSSNRGSEVLSARDQEVSTIPEKYQQLLETQKREDIIEALTEI
ncbi:hypothetical protein KCU64_g182, partial [Aureobasidium melanogenum]